MEIINRFEKESQRGKGSRVMRAILNDLIGYTQEHFAFEEKLMAETCFTGLELHQSIHRQLLQKVERFQYEFIHNKKRINTEVREFLKYWLLTHIQNEDMEFAEYAKSPETAPAT